MITSFQKASVTIQAVAGAIIFISSAFYPQTAVAKKKNLSQHVELKEVVEQYLKQFKVPYGAFVAIEPTSGKVLAAVEFSQDKNRKKPLYLDDIFPAASIFKIITSAALLERGGVSLNTKTCYHGGSQKLLPANIKDNPKKDKICKSLKDGFAFSTNALFGKLALKHLSQETLKEYAEKFGFNQKAAFEPPLKFGTADIPSDDLSFARTAAGFANVTLSPIHGALIAAAIANGGWMPFPVFNGDAESKKKELAEVVTPETAGKIKTMMVATSIYGTARKYFKNRSVYLKGISIATKTGSLNASYGGRTLNTSWMIGFAPADNPEIAFAAVVANSDKWHIKSGHIVKKALNTFFELKSRKKNRS